jgi:hypothetical protein
MSDGHSTPSGKPAKPFPDFPLFPHAAGVWAKKIRGKMHYFGKWDDPDAYLAQKDDLHAGRQPRPAVDGVMVKDVVNAFLNHKKTLLDVGELSPRSWDDYKATTPPSWLETATVSGISNECRIGRTAMKSSSIILALPLALFAGLAVGCSGSNVSAPATTASPNALPPIRGLVESIDLDKNVMPRPLERPADV